MFPSQRSSFPLWFLFLFLIPRGYSFLFFFLFQLLCIDREGLTIWLWIWYHGGGGGDAQWVITVWNRGVLSHEFGSEWVSKQINKWVQQSTRVKRAVRSKQMSEWCEGTSKWISGWPSTLRVYSLIIRLTVRRLCDSGKSDGSGGSGDGGGQRGWRIVSRVEIPSGFMFYSFSSSGSLPFLSLAAFPNLFTFLWSVCLFKNSLVWIHVLLMGIRHMMKRW